MSMNLYNIDLLPILLALIVIVSIVLWVAIRNYKNFLLMFFLIPLALYSGWTVYATVDKLLGYPVIENFEKDTLYISHFENPNVAEWIYVWVLKPGEDKPKAIMIPNSEENQEQLSEAEQKSSEGVPQYMEMQDGQGQTNGGELHVYDFYQNWGDVEKEQQRNRDAQEERERVIPGPVPREVPGPRPDNRRPTLQIDETRTDEYGGNDMIIWRPESDIDDSLYDFSFSEDDNIGP